MTLFDPSPYGEPRPVRKRTEKLPLLKLTTPWVLARYRKKPPLAHLPFGWTDVKDAGTGAKWKAFMPECDHKTTLAPLFVEGEPLVEVCRSCLDFARKTGLVVILKERPD